MSFSEFSLFFFFFCKCGVLNCALSWCMWHGADDSEMSSRLEKVFIPPQRKTNGNFSPQNEEAEEEAKAKANPSSQRGQKKKQVVQNSHKEILKKKRGEATSQQMRNTWMWAEEWPAWIAAALMSKKEVQVCSSAPPYRLAPPLERLRDRKEPSEWQLLTNPTTLTVTVCLIYFHFLTVIGFVCK